jgi:hypothetical protein
MKKFAKIISVIAVIAVITVTAIRFIAPSLFFGYIYPFNRIKGIVSVSVDGKDISLSDCEISCSKNGKAEKVLVNGSKIKNRAGEYGKYIYTVKYNDVEFLFCIYQTNCWNCEKFDVSFNVDTAKQTVSCTGWTRGLKENGLKEAKKFLDKTINLDNNDVICIAGV